MIAQYLVVECSWILKSADDQSAQQRSFCLCLSANVMSLISTKLSAIWRLDWHYLNTSCPDTLHCPARFLVSSQSCLCNAACMVNFSCYHAILLEYLSNKSFNKFFVRTSQSLCGDSTNLHVNSEFAINSKSHITLVSMVTLLLANAPPMVSTYVTTGISVRYTRQVSCYIH